MTETEHRLVLLRHAKSSWAASGQPDHERPLAPRGHRATADLRRHVAEAGLAPDLVLCSTARRAVETWEGIAPGLPAGTPVEIEPDLYGASAGELLGRLQRVPETVGCVLVVAHNPGLEDLAATLTAHGADDLRERLVAKFPTGALATLAVPAPWSGLRWGRARLEDYVVPRELPVDLDS